MKDYFLITFWAVLGLLLFGLERTGSILYK